MACAPSEDSDQPGHPPSLIRVFAVRMKKTWVLSYPLSAQKRLLSDWADDQADLTLRWAHAILLFFLSCAGSMMYTRIGYSVNVIRHSIYSVINSNSAALFQSTTLSRKQIQRRLNPKAFIYIACAWLYLPVVGL